MTSKWRTRMLALWLLSCGLNVLGGSVVGAWAAGPSLPAELAQHEALRGKAIQVVVFVSPKCPCSRSHEAGLKRLQEKYASAQPSVGFLGVHANDDVSAAESRAHFLSGTGGTLGFAVVEHPSAAVLEGLPALKTPHVFVFRSAGDARRPEAPVLVYRGGVDDAHDAADAKKHYLEEVLAALVAGKPSPHTQTRVLGCVIARK